MAGSERRVQRNGIRERRREDSAGVGASTASNINMGTTINGYSAKQTLRGSSGAPKAPRQTERRETYTHIGRFCAVMQTTW